jgi:hypothetical protein
MKVIILLTLIALASTEVTFSQGFSSNIYGPGFNGPYGGGYNGIYSGGYGGGFNGAYGGYGGGFGGDFDGGYGAGYSGGAYNIGYGGTGFGSSGFAILPGAIQSYNNNCGSNGFWDSPSQCCKCNSPYVWITGGCQQPQTCGMNSLWTGSGCSCNYGYFSSGSQCQQVNQIPYCPPNSRFNGVNCQCMDGFFPVNKGRC